MNKISKKIISVLGGVALSLLVILPFIPLGKIHATPEKVWLLFDSASVSGNVVTFDVEGTNVTATVSGQGYIWNEGKLEITYSDIRNVIITLDSNYDGMKVTTHTGQDVATTEQREMVIGDIDFSTDDMMHIQVVKNNVGINNTQEYQGNSSATLNYKISGEIDYDAGNGYDYGIGFYINGLQYKADDSKVVTTSSSLDITGDTINYDASGDTVNFTFVMAPGTLMTGLKINNHVVTGLPDDAAELEACYTDHRLDIPVNGIEKASTYNIEIEARFPDASEEFMSNFLWDYNPQGYTAQDDKILHGTLEFVKAEYNGHTYTKVSDINALGGVFIWKDAERKESYTDDREGCGEAQFPKGTELTVKIIPDAGYQLVSFGLNGGVFAPQEEIGTYTFDVMSGPFHLQAEIQKVDDIVKSSSGAVTAGAITLGDETSMSVGTARLDVKDVNLSDDQISNFEEAAGEFEVENYLDISLYNTVYKGSADQSWDTKVEELNHEAEISLQLGDNVNGKEIVVVHETHDGKYEIIETEYLEEYNAIVFKTDSFSNYAIATKGEAEDRMHTVTFDSNGGSSVAAAVVKHGNLLERPTTPTKDGYTFGGWYLEPDFYYSFDFESPIEGDFTLIARWIDNDKLKDYTVTDDNGNSISFTDEEGHNYKITLFDILSQSKEVIMAMDPEMTEETYNLMMDLLKKLAKPTGTLLKLYEIEVYEDNAVTGDTTSLHEGPFKIKIKITDDMKDYNTFKLVYLKNDFTTGEVIDLTVEDGYLVGTIPHLSTYMLTGSNTTPTPKTGDNILIYMSILGLSIIGLLGIGLYSIKKKN